MKSGSSAGIWLLSGLGATLLVAGLTWFLQNYELRSERIDAGYSAAARRNPFLAAERILARLGIPVQSVSGRDLLRDLPPPDDTMVVNSMRALNASRRDALHEWISGGGRLIVEAVEPWEDTEEAGPRGTGFLGRYGVRLRELEQQPEGSVPDDEAVATVDMEDYPYPISVAFASRYYLEDTSGEATAGVPAGEHLRLLQYRIGDGLLTVTSDNGFLSNSHIGRYDNALFLALMARPPGDGKIWLLYDSAVPWIGVLLWHQAPFAVVSFLCLTGLFLWHLGARLGPLLPLPAGDRRDLMAHLDASARFLWRSGQGARLTAPGRERVEQAWLRRHPVLRELDRAQRAAWIAQRADLAPEDVLRSLYPTGFRAEDLVTEAALLQRLWASLSGAGGHRESPPSRQRKM